MGGGREVQKDLDRLGCIIGDFSPQTGREFQARNWKDFSGALGFGQPRQNVRHGGQLLHH